MFGSPTSSDSGMSPAPLRDRAPRPPGVLPRHVQTWFVAGVAGLMVVVMLLTGRTAPPDARSAAPKALPTVDASDARIREYRARVDEQARRLEAEQAELALAKQALGRDTRSDLRRDSPRTAGTEPVPDGSASGDGGASARQDQEQRAYRSLYADNLAWSARPAGTATRERSLTSTVGTGSTRTAPSAVMGPAATAAERGPATPSPSPAAKVASRPEESAEPAGEPTYVLQEGTVIEGVLTNRVDGSFPGPVNVMVTTPVYAPDAQHLLIPRGSRLLGQATPVSQFGQQRLAVAFHRVIFPDGHSASLDHTQALDQVGEAGLRDKVDHHYLETFGASLAIGALAGFAQRDTVVGLDSTAGDAYRQGLSSSVTQSSMRILDRFLNRLPTITIREGHRVKVYLSADLPLPLYTERPPEGVAR